MSVQPIVNASLLSNPRLNADPSRYSAQDVLTAPQLNRTIAWFMKCIPWVGIEGRQFEVRGHDVASNGRDAQFYLNDGVTPITAETPYIVSTAGPPTRRITLKQISARADIRDMSQAVLSEFYEQREFQEQAIAHAVWAQWENGAINGNATATPEQFDGLPQIVLGGGGQTVDASALPISADLLRAFEAAMQLIKSHSRRVDLILMNTDAWRKTVDLLRGRGFRPDHRFCPLAGQSTLYIDDVPVCLSDHIPTDAATKFTAMYVMSLGEPNGVFGVVNRNAPAIAYHETHREDSPFTSVQGHFYSALVSTTSDALVEIQNYDTAL